MRLLVPVLSFLTAIGLCDAWILTTAKQLPAQVVTKWMNGVATNVSPRDEWIGIALSMTTMIGLAVGLLGILSLRYFPRFFHHAIPAFPSAIREQVIRQAQVGCLVLGAWVSIWMTWFHGIVVAANSTTPPHLGWMDMVWWVGAHLFVVALFVFAMYRLIRKAKKTTALEA